MKKIFTLCCVVAASFPLFSQNMNLTLAAQLSYGTQTCANICGYTVGNNEYALVGGAQGMSIVNVTVPTAPVIIVQIPMVNNLWKEIKVYKHWAYVTTEGNGGALQIVDLNAIPATTASSYSYHTYTGNGAIAGQLSTVHALHIDTTKKFVYLFGTNLFGGGAVVLDINADPYNPTYAGKYQNAAANYVHDGYVDNDTLYACHIYQGFFSVVDMTNKSAPVILATQSTPNNFTHNAWLSDDKKTVFTTDETANSYMTGYDISDLNNITETDRIQTTPGSGSYVHNTHIKNNWAVVSWYRDGIAVIDVTRPHNLVVVGRYDTYPVACCVGEDGAWGVYPYFPSGTIVVSNIDEGLFVLSPNYVRACYLEGLVTDSLCGSPLNNVTITISTVNVTDMVDNTGNYAMGTAIPGTYNVTFSKPGYNPKTITGVNFSAGVVTNLNVQLFSPSTVATTGNISDVVSSTGLPNVNVSFTGANNYNFVTDASGNFSSCNIVAGTYTVTTGAWGYETVCNTVNISTSSTTVNLALQREYYDDFSLDLGWTVATTATTGAWVRGVPVGTTNGAAQANPGADVTTDCTNQAYVTGNGGGSASTDDVDGGATTLTSPQFDLTGYPNPYVEYDRWFYNGGGSGGPNDSLKISLSNGSTTVLLETVIATSLNNSSWVHSSKRVSSYLTPTSNMHLIVRTADAASGHIVEAGLDRFMVIDSAVTTSVQNISSDATLSAYPNPFTQDVKINWNLSQAPLNGDLLQVMDLTGRIVLEIPVHDQAGSVTLGSELADGMYVVRMITSGIASAPMEIVRTR